MLFKCSRRRAFHRAPSSPQTTLRIAAIALLAAALTPTLRAQAHSIQQSPSTRQTPSAQPDPTARQAVQLMVKREIADHSREKAADFFRYLSVERSSRTGGRLWTEEVVEVHGGRLRRLIAIDGKPLSAAQQAEEDHRLQTLARNPAAFAKINRARQKDEARVTKIIERMPKEFLFQYDALPNHGPRTTPQTGCRRIAYRPNPAYHPTSFEDRVVYNMVGFVSIDEPSMRLCSVTGHLVQTVDFGFGLLGHVSQGSGFTLGRTPVEPAVWRSTLLNMHFNGAIFFFKSISRSQHTVRSHFQPVPSYLTLPQAVALSRPSAQP